MKTILGAATVAVIAAASGLAMAQSSTSPGTTSPGTSSPGMTSPGTSGSTAGASAQTATGTVSKIDRSGNAVTLSDGQSYKLSSSADLSKVKEGDQVRIQYRTQGGDRMASDISQVTGSAGSSMGGSSSGSSGSGSSSSGTTGTTSKK